MRCHCKCFVQEFYYNSVSLSKHSLTPLGWWFKEWARDPGSFLVDYCFKKTCSSEICLALANSKWRKNEVTNFAVLIVIVLGPKGNRAYISGLIFYHSLHLHYVCPQMAWLVLVCFPYLRDSRLRRF